jgi:4-azaleucine resistance transporter AzlC
MTDMRSLWRDLNGAVVRDIAFVCLAVAVVGVAYGATATSAGFPPWFPVLLGVLVLAASAEFMFIGIVAAGGSPIAAVVAGMLVNARHLPYGMALNQVLGTGWRRLLGAHLMNDETVVFALGQESPEEGRAAFWASGLGILVCWPTGALAGALAGTAISNTDALGMDAMFPAIVLALVFPALRESRTRTAAVTGAAIALAAVPFAPPGVPPLLALVGLLTTRPWNPDD